MKKIGMICLIALLLVSFCGCDSFEDTPETDAAFAAYEAAVKQTVAHKKGAIKVTTVNEDSLDEKNNSQGTIEYTFSTDAEEKVTFERNDITNGELVASYKADGKAAYQLDLPSGEWLDVTEESKAMLQHSSNYMNTLSLFRIDHNFRYSKHFYESVAMEETEQGKVVIFTLKSKAVSDMFAHSDERQIRREQASQVRSFYINDEGDLEKIVIDSLQNVEYKGTAGQLKNCITVEMDYE